MRAFDSKSTAAEALLLKKLTEEIKLTKEAGKDGLAQSAYNEMFIRAVQGSHLSAIKYLVKKRNVDINVLLAFESGLSCQCTALIFAVSKNNLELAHLLTELGANPNIGPPLFTAPLVVAVSNRNLEMTQCLVRAGAGVHQAIFITPLSIAAGNGDLEIVRYLVEKGKADVNRDKVGCQCDASHALGLAVEKGHFPVVRFLVQSGASTHYTFCDSRYNYWNGSRSNIMCLLRGFRLMAGKKRLTKLLERIDKFESEFIKTSALSYEQQLLCKRPNELFKKKPEELTHRDFQALISHMIFLRTAYDHYQSQHSFLARLVNSPTSESPEELIKDCKLLLDFTKEYHLYFFGREAPKSTALKRTARKSGFPSSRDKDSKSGRPHFFRSGDFASQDISASAASAPSSASAASASPSPEINPLPGAVLG